ncbi:MAG TPA: hypothetical protein VK688_00530, partial [Gemmatimonadales bacterium]|nr:hypothetical protein [Gemmatimonadales bacterium]
MSSARRLLSLIVRAGVVLVVLSQWIGPAPLAARQTGHCAGHARHSGHASLAIATERRVEAASAGGP